MAPRNSRTAAAAAKKKNGISVDFTGVEGSVVIPEGDYSATVNEITVEEGDKAQYLKWEFGITDEGFTGKKVYTNTSLAPQSLWVLRNLLETMGFDVPDGPLDLDFDEVKGQEIGVTITHGEYNGKKTNQVTDFFMLETGEVAGTDNEKSVAGKDKADKGGKDDKPIKLKADEVAELGEEDLAAIVEKHKLGIDLDEHKTLRKKTNAVLDKLESMGLLEE